MKKDRPFLGITLYSHIRIYI